MIEAEMAHIQQQEYEKGLELERQKEVERVEQSIRYQEELERQLEEQERKRQEAYEEFLKEKLMIDEICRKIYEEDQRELQARLEKQQATREYITEFLHKREEVRFDLPSHYYMIAFFDWPLMIASDSLNEISNF